MKDGYITIPRAVLDSWVGQNETYLKWWAYLRSEACYQERTVWHNNQQVHLRAAQLIGTLTALQEAWHVSKHTVIRFLRRLEQDKLVERQKDSRKTIITITQLGWGDGAEKTEVQPEVQLHRQVDRQPLLQLHPLYNKETEETDNRATREARTREEAVAENDFDEIVSFFNEQMSGKKIPQVMMKTAERKQALEQLLATGDVDTEKVKQAIRNAAESDFLNGNGQKGWIADFDWMMVPAHFQKVLENFYRNKDNNQLKPISYGATEGYSDPRRGVEASRTATFAAGYDRPF